MRISLELARSDSVYEGMATKFFTCTLALMYRGEDDNGEIQGGVMYYIEEGLGEKFKPLAVMFGLSGLIGCTIFFQANQLSQIIREYFYNSIGIFQEEIFVGDLVTGFLVAIIVLLPLKLLVIGFFSGPISNFIFRKRRSLSSKISCYHHIGETWAQ